MNGKGGTYEVWESGGGLMFQKGAASPARLASDARFAAAAALPKGGAAVAWGSQARGKATLLAEVLE